MSLTTVHPSMVSLSAAWIINQFKYRQVHVYIITEHCGCSRKDHYLNGIVEALRKFEHRVTIVACAIDTDAAINFIYKNDERPRPCGRWIIRSIFGYFRSFFTYLTLIWGAIYIFFSSYNILEEGVVLVDNATAVLPILKISLYPIIYIQHFPEFYEIDRFYSRYRLKTNLADYYFIKYADHIIVESTGLKEIFQNLYPIAKAPITPLHYITDCKLLLPSVPHKKVFPKLKLFKGMAVYLCIGRYNEHSNLYFLFKIIDCIVKNYAEYKEKITIIFVSEEEKLDPASLEYCEIFRKKSLSQKYHLNLIFVNKAKPTYSESLFSKAIAILHTNPCEYYPGPILRAMALQKPIIGPTTGFASEVLINYFSGLLVDYEAEQYAAAMVEILLDEDLRNDLGSNAFNEFKHHYSENALAAKINEIILSPKV